MKLIKLLGQILEGKCQRKDGESDEDFLQRCGNALQTPHDYQYHNSRAVPFDTSVRDTDRKLSEIDTADHAKDCNCPACKGNDNEMDILGTDLDESEEDWMARKTQEILDRYKETRLKGLSNEDKNLLKPHTQATMRPEPHPTRHETEHPPYEKAATQNMNAKFQPPNRKIMQVKSVARP
jgi:hypothetical protein